MARRLFAAATLSLPVALLSVLAIGAPTAAAKPAPATVQLSAKPLQIASDGSVTVEMVIRCASPLNAFEYGAGVRQGAAFGGTTVGSAANVVPCDGTRHRVAVRVAPFVGEFSAGRANLDANVNLYDPDQDEDLEARDNRTVTLRVPR